MSRDMTFSDFDYDITNYRNSSDYDIMQDDIDNIDQAIEMKFQERFTKAGRKLAIADLYIEKCKKEGKKFSQYSEAVLSKAKKFQRKALNQIAKWKNTKMSIIADNKKTQENMKKIREINGRLSAISDAYNDVIKTDKTPEIVQEIQSIVKMDFVKIDKNAIKKNQNTTKQSNTAVQNSKQGSADFYKLMNQLDQVNKNRSTATIKIIEELDDKQKKNEQIVKAAQERQKEAVKANKQILAAGQKYRATLAKQQKELSNAQRMVSADNRKTAQDLKKLRRQMEKEEYERRVKENGSSSVFPGEIVVHDEDIYNRFPDLFTGSKSKSRKFPNAIIKRASRQNNYQQQKEEQMQVIDDYFGIVQKRKKGRPKKSTIKIIPVQANDSEQKYVQEYIINSGIKTAITPKTLGQPKKYIRDARQYYEPVQVELNTKNNAHEYKILDAAIAKKFKNQQEINARTRTASATGAGLIPYNYTNAGASAAKGTAFHLISELLDKGVIDLTDLRGGSSAVEKKINKQYSKDEAQQLIGELSAGSFFDKNGQVANPKLIEQRLQTLKYDSMGHTAYFGNKPAVELALGALTKLNGEEYLLAGALDRVIKTKNGLFIEDIKNKKTRPHPFTEATQLLTQAKLLEANAEKLGITGEDILGGRIAQYNPKTDEESFRSYEIGTSEDLQKILLMNERLRKFIEEEGIKPEEASQNERYRTFAKQLAEKELSSYYKKLFLEELNMPENGYGLSTTTRRINGKMITYPQFLLGGDKNNLEYSTLSFESDEKTGDLIATKGNKLYQNWLSGYNSLQRGIKDKKENLQTRGQNLMNRSMEIIRNGLVDSKDAYAASMVMSSMERLMNTDRATPEIKKFAQEILDMKPDVTASVFNAEKLTDVVKLPSYNKKTHTWDDPEDLEKAKSAFISLASESGSRFGDILSDPYGTELYQLFGARQNPFEQIAQAILIEQQQKKEKTEEQEPERKPGSYQDFRNYYDSIISGIQSKDFNTRWNNYKKINQQYYDNPTTDNYKLREEAISTLLDRGGVNQDILDHFENWGSVSHLSTMMGLIDQNWANLSKGDVEQVKRIFAGRLFNQYNEKDTEFNFARGFARNYFASDIYDTYGNKNLTKNQQKEKGLSQALQSLEQDVLAEYKESNGEQAAMSRIDLVRGIMDKLSSEYMRGIENEDINAQTNFHQKYGEQGERLVKQYRYLLKENNGELSERTIESLKDAFSEVDLLEGGNKNMSTQNVLRQKDIYGNTGYDILHKFDTPLAGLMRVDKDTIAGGEAGVWAWVDNEGNIHRYDPNDTTAKEVKKAAQEENKVKSEVKKTSRKRTSKIKQSPQKSQEDQENYEDRIANSKLEKEIEPTKEQPKQSNNGFDIEEYITLKKDRELRPYIQEYESLLRERNRILKESNKLDQEIDESDNEEEKKHLQERKDLHDRLLKDVNNQLSIIESKDYRGNDQGMRDAFAHLSDVYDTRSIIEISKLKDKSFISKSSQGGSKKGGKPGRQIQTLGDAAGSWIERLLTGGIWMKLFGQITRGVRKVIDIAKQLDETMINLRVVTGLNQEQTYGLINSYAELGKQLGATTTQVANAANDWLRQGYAMSEVNDLITASLYLSKLGMISTEEATKNLTSAMKGFKIEASSAMDIVDKLTAIDINAATSAGEIANGLAQFANLANMTGVNLDQASSYVATIADVTQMSGSSAGQAMKMILSRFGTVKSGKYNKLNVDSETNDESAKLNDVETILNKMGIAVRKTNLEFRDFDDVLDDVAERWRTLDTVSKNAIATAFAGTRQREAFATLMENYDKYEELLKVSEESEGTAERKYLSYMEQLTASTNKLTAAWEQFTNNAQVNKMLKNITDYITKIVEQLPKLIKYLTYIVIQTRGGTIVKSIGNKIAGMLGYTDAEGNPIDFKKEKIGAKVIRKIFPGKKGEKIEETPKQNGEVKFEEQKTEQLQTQVSLEKQKTEELQKQVQAEKQKNEESKQQVVSEQQESLEDTKQLQSEKQSTIEDQKQTMQEKSSSVSGVSGGAGISGGKLSSATIGKISGILSIASYGVTQLLSGLNAYTQSGATHTSAVAGMGTVESSKEAEQAYKSISTSFATAIPLVGQFLGDWIGETVAKNIDKVRDEMMYNSQQAQEQLSNLGAVKQTASTLSALSGSLDTEDVKQRNETANEFLSSMYSKEGAQTRTLLEKYLSEIYGEQVTLSGVMKKYTDGTEKERIEAAKKLEIAEKKARVSQTAEAKKTDLYSSELELEEAYKNYGSVDTSGAALAGIGVGTGTAFASAGIGTGVGALVGSVVPVIGTAVGALIGLAAGGIAGIIGGALTGKSVYEAELEKQWKEEVDKWDNSDVHERMDIIEKRRGKAIDLTSAANIALNKKDGWQNDISNILEEMTKNGEISETESKLFYDQLTTMSDNQLSSLISGQQDLIESSENMNNTLQRYIDQQQAVIDSMNKAYVDLALTEAKSGENYLTEMNIAQLKELGITGIYKAIADALESEGGLINIDTYTAAGEFTDAFISEVTSKLKEDEEIAAALRGENYSLFEAYKKLDPNDQFSKQILQNFANALGITLEQLSEQQVALTEKYGLLTLGEMLSSTSDLDSRTSSLISLTGTIIEGSSSISQWMGTITNQFPELLAYTSDVPALMSQIISKTKQLSQVYIQSQYADIAQSSELYDRLIRDSVEGASDNAKDLLKDAGVTNIKELQTWLNSQDINTGDAKAIYEKLLEASESYNLTSDIYKEQLNNVINYNSKLLDRQINNLSEQKTALEQINKEREYENQLVEARLKLENAQKEKKRVWREGVGWVYESDQSAIKEAQENIDNLTNQKQISELEQQIIQLTEDKAKLDQYWDEQEFDKLSQFYDAWSKEFGESGSMRQLYKSIDTLSKGIDVPLSEVIKTIATGDADDRATVLGDLESSWDAYQAALDDYKSAGSNATNEQRKAVNNALATYQSNFQTAQSRGYINQYSNNGWEGEGTTYGSMESYNVGTGIANRKLVMKETAALKAPNGHILNMTTTGEQLTTTEAQSLIDAVVANEGMGKGSYRSGDANVAWRADGTPINPQNDNELRITKDTKLSEYAAQLRNTPVVIGNENKGIFTYVKNGIAYKLNMSRSQNGSPHWFEKNALGTLDSRGELSLLNELGTEAIITPRGTITALPSHSGVVPADITENLWNLGKAAPAISKWLDTIGLSNPSFSPNGLFSTDESFNIQTLNMNVTADDSFDADAFVKSIKTQAALSKNNR